MAVTFLSSIRGCGDLKQVTVDVSAPEVNTNIFAPVMPSDTFKGYLVGPLGLTFPASNAQTFQPMPETDSIVVYRLIPVSTSTVDVILRSVTPAGATSFSSPAFPLTSPSPVGVSDDVPIFECKPGDRLAFNVDAASTFLAIIGVKGRFGK